MAGSSINLWKSTLTSFLHFLDSLVRSALFFSLALLNQHATAYIVTLDTTELKKRAIILGLTFSFLRHLT